MRVTNDDDLRVGCICKFPWMAAQRITELTETSVELEVLRDNGFKRRFVMPRKGFTKSPAVVLLPNARFWTWGNDGFVKVTVKPSKTLTHVNRSGFTEEGWSSLVEWWTYDADECVIQSHAVSTGRDCDGRYEHHSTHHCSVANLAAVPPREADPEYQIEAIPFARPQWEQGLEYQRDYAAEFLGY